MTDSNPPTERRTRAKNANQHPGQVDQIRKRRTKAEIAHEDALLQAKKEEKTRKQNKAIMRIAELEDQMAVDDVGAENAHPRNHEGLSILF
jgi:hypothetical protein